MKTTVKFAVVLMIFAFLGASVNAAENKALSVKKYELIEMNLLSGMGMDNEGVQTSSAYYLGEMKSKKAIIPLMKMLHDGKTESTRISAALALIKIGDSRGVFAVKQARFHDKSEKVRNTCKLFYSDFMKSKKS